jgi:molybdate transport system ATP-binding protein
LIEIAIEKKLGGFTLNAGLNAPEDGITALFGRSGAGKSTVINALAGLVKPDRGRIVIGGDVLFDSERRINLPPERRRLGYVFQEGRLFPHYMVRGNLLYGAKKNGGGPSFDTVVQLLGIEQLLNRRPAQLSGGEKQRVAIGRALLASPRLLLMDEPLASLDAARKGEILPFIEKLRDELKLPVFYVSHEMDEIIRLADLLVIIDGGKVAAAGSVEDLTSRLDLWPLTGRHEAGAVISTTLRGHDTRFGLSELAFPGGRLRVTRLNLPLGTPVRVRIRARDVVLATEKPTHLSIRNAFAGTVIEVAEARGPVVDLRLDIGTAEQPVMLWGRVTMRALQELQLAPGTPIFALVKTVSLDRHSYGRFETNETEAS